MDRQKVKRVSTTTTEPGTGIEGLIRVTPLVLGKLLSELDLEDVEMIELKIERLDRKDVNYPGWRLRAMTEA